MTLWGDPSSPFGVTFAFTERAGGVSEGCFSSLNLGGRCGDDPACVDENRALALRALGAPDDLSRLVCPRQVHGDRVVVVSSANDASVLRAREDVEAGADAVVCTAAGVPVLLCFADCVPVVVVGPGGFAVVHSGWRGTIARIAGKAARALADALGAGTDELVAYVGPHVLAEDYEVSPDLAQRFRAGFGAEAVVGERNLDLGFCVRSALVDAGVPKDHVVDPRLSTYDTQRFFSYRASGGACGRHGALALIP